jgi:hypothetical protein
MPSSTRQAAPASAAWIYFGAIGKKIAAPLDIGDTLAVASMKALLLSEENRVVGVARIADLTLCEAPRNARLRLSAVPPWAGGLGIAGCTPV